MDILAQFIYGVVKPLASLLTTRKKKQKQQVFYSIHKNCVSVVMKQLMCLETLSDPIDLCFSVCTGVDIRALGNLKQREQESMKKVCRV